MTSVSFPQYQQKSHHNEDVDVDQLLAGPLAMPNSDYTATSNNKNGGAPFHDITNRNNNNSSNNNNNNSFQKESSSSNLADPNRAQNVALKVQLAASERELAQCRHALDLALVKAGNWSGMKHRVTLAKPLNGAPVKQWASAPTAQQQSSPSDRSSFVINSLQTQLREKENQLNHANAKMQELLEQNEELKVKARNNNNNNGVIRHQDPHQHGSEEHLLGSAEEAKSAQAAHLMGQTRFLLKEVDRLERALSEQRERDSANAVQRGMQTARELQQRDAKIGQLTNQLSSLKNKLTPLQKAALKTTREGEVSPMDLLTRIGALEQDLNSALAARTDALNEKYSLQAKVRKLEEKIREAKNSCTETTASAAEEVTASFQQVARLRDALATVNREKDNLQAALDIRRLRDASKRLATSECQTDEKMLCDSGMQTEATERPKAEAFCQVEAVDAAGNPLYGGGPLKLLPPGSSLRSSIGGSRMNNQQHQSSSNNQQQNTSSSSSSTTDSNSSPSTNQILQSNDALSIAHSLELKCAELDNVRARLEEQSLHLERANIALKQTREALGAEVEVRKGLDSESERNKAQIRTLQQTVSQLHVLMRDRDAALSAADERAQQALNDSVKLAQERKNWEKQLAANAHDFEQLLAQQATANQQVAQAAQENESLREEVQRLLQREAQLSHALRAKDGELAEILSSYQMCVQEKEGTDQSCKSMERECNNLKSALHVREERLAELQREIGVLHQREEQLTTDVQACDYENSLLHRKVVQAETSAQQFQGILSDLEQQLQAQRRVTGQFEHAQAELHKQLIRKDNEVVFLKKRCEIVEHENTMLQTAHSVDSRKIRELDEANARLTVSGLMTQLNSSSAHQPSRSSQQQQGSSGNFAADQQIREAAKIRHSLDEFAERNGQLARQIEVKEGSIAQLQQQLTEERKNVELLRHALSEKTVQLEEQKRTLEQLQELLQEQANNMAQFAAQHPNVNRQQQQQQQRQNQHQQQQYSD